VLIRVKESVCRIVARDLEIDISES
jgi:hypothetical protein